MNEHEILERAVARLIEKTREALAPGLTRESLFAVRSHLLALSAQRELFAPERFPLPPGQNSVMYILHSEPDESTTLYVNVCGPGIVSPAHDHGTWALVAGLLGVEENRFYRTRAPLHQDVEEVGRMNVEHGKAIALLPDDVHSISTGDQALMMGLHFYGLSLPRQTARRAFGLPGSTPSAYAPQPEIRAWPR
ncbi:hypothetical protein AB4Z46_33335 [Variovorax sp. M-6]|uniref:hypothetical protein n=1 Tax=Variovorax sp. M-6 TaxID=3233041 RepID=UPI003F9BAFA7